MNLFSMLSFHISTRACLGAAALLMCTGLHAQIESNDSSIVDLPKVTVVASRVEQSTGVVGASVTTLDLDDLLRYEHELASDVIRHVEGVYLRNNGNPGSTAGMSMRGLPLAPVVLIDGIEVNDPGSGFVYNFGNLPLASIDRIEVLRGAQSALYGANALTGVISITTRQGETTQPAAAVGASYGSRDSVRAFATLSQATESVDYFVTATYEDTDGYSVQNPEWGPEWADDDLFRNQTMMGKLKWKLSDRVDLVLFGSYQDSKSEYDPGLPSPWTQPVMDNFYESEQFLSKAQLSATLSQAWISNVAVHYNDFRSYAVDSFGVRDNKADLLKFEWLNDLRIADWLNSIVGLEWERAEDRIGSHSMDTAAVFVENVLTLSDALHATVALRLDDNDAYGREVSWRTSASYALPNDRTRLKASFGTSFDAPEISELFGTWGNPDLTPETGSNFDIGMEQVFSDQLRGGITFFRIGMDDHIEYLRSTNQYANVDWESTGLESYLEWDVNQQLMLRVGHTWADAERKGVDDTLLFHSPEHTLSLMVDFSMLDDRLQHAITIQYVDERETWDGPVDAFTVVDWSTRFQVNEQASVWLRVENLLDETYEEILYYRAPGLGVFGGFKLEF